MIYASLGIREAQEISVYPQLPARFRKDALFVISTSSRALPPAEAAVRVWEKMGEAR